MMDHSIQNWQNSQNLEVSKLMEIVLVFSLKQMLTLVFLSITLRLKQDFSTMITLQQS